MTTSAEMPGLCFGSWTVLQRDTTKKGWYWHCRCACGTQKSVFGGNLTSGKTLSCGHDREEQTRARALKHGHSSGGQMTRVFRIYRGMLQRCYNPKQKTFQNYGAKGVTICAAWLGANGFVTFLQDMGVPPAGTSIERKENTRGYEPGNCVWADRYTQARNKSNVHLIDGVPKTLWAVQHGVSLSQLYKQAKKEQRPIIEILNEMKEKLHAQNIC